MTPSARPARIGILTVSDRASSGGYADASGPAMHAVLAEILASPWEAVARTVPDGVESVRDALIRLVDDAHCDLVLTTGGTGPRPHPRGYRGRLRQDDARLRRTDAAARPGSGADRHPVAADGGPARQGADRELSRASLVHPSQPARRIPGHPVLPGPDRGSAYRDGSGRGAGVPADLTRRRPPGLPRFSPLLAMAASMAQRALRDCPPSKARWPVATRENGYAYRMTAVAGSRPIRSRRRKRPRRARA